MKYLILILLIGCSKEAILTEKTDNEKIKVELMFTHRGCNIYRFMDDRYVYFSECGHAFRQNYTESCGKSCTRNIRQTTLGLKIEGGK